MNTAPTAPPSRPQIMSFSSTAINLTWEPPPAEHANGILRHYTVSYQEQESSLEFSVTSNTSSTTLLSLHPHFTYVIRVRAETVSPGPFSETQSVQLEEDGMFSVTQFIYFVYYFTIAPSSSVLDLVVESVNSRAISLTWMPPLFSKLNGIIRSYIVFIAETDTGSIYNFTSFMTNLTVSQLHPHYTYSCAVSPVTIKPGPQSSAVLITTPEDG